MTTTIDRAAPAPVRGADPGPSRVTRARALLACGVAYAVFYPVVNDGIAATLYDGYSRLDQAVSELSAAGAPTQNFLTATGPIFVLLLIGFGLGIWRSAHGKRSLRVAGALVMAHGAMSFLWMFAPMSQREVIAAGGATWSDSMHLILASATGIFVSAYTTATAVAFGWAFRIYSLATIAASLTFGLLSAQVGKIEAGDPTPYMGLLERIGIGAWLLWLVVVALILLRHDPGASRDDPGTFDARLHLFRVGRRPGAEDRRARTGARRIVIGTLGALAGLAGAEHGIGEILQGSVRPKGLVIESWPTAPAMEILQGEPAMTVVPNLLVTGILATVVALGAALWAIYYSSHPRFSSVFVVLSVLLLLVGGGFGPPLLGLIVGIGAMHKAGSSRRSVGSVMARVWPWFLFVAVFGYLGLMPGTVLLSLLADYESTGLIAALSVLAFSGAISAMAGAGAQGRT